MDWIAASAIWGAVTGTGAIVFEVVRWRAETRRRRVHEEQTKPQLGVSISAEFRIGVPSLCVEVENRGPRAVDFPEVSLVVSPVGGKIIGHSETPACFTGRVSFAERPEQIQPGDTDHFHLRGEPPGGLPRGATGLNKMHVEVRADGRVERVFDNPSVRQAVQEFVHRIDTDERRPGLKSL